LPDGDLNEQIVELARRLQCGLIVMGQREAYGQSGGQNLEFSRLAKNAHCSVCLVAAPAIPQQIAECFLILGTQI
jgi:hypothetical protein